LQATNLTNFIPCINKDITVDDLKINKNSKKKLNESKNLKRNIHPVNGGQMQREGSIVSGVRNKI
jgi:hypothetical protein